MFQDEAESDKDVNAASSIMMSLLKEPVFNVLRTQEQLGYIVNAAKS